VGANLGLVRAVESLAKATGPQFVDMVAAQSGAAADELRRGLQLERAAIPPKFFYDRLGSALFTSICELPEYYPTRTEAGIMALSMHDLSARLPGAATLIDLGAGDCAKAARLLPQINPSQYVAIDISSEFVRAALERLSREYPSIDLLGLGMDFSRELRLPTSVNPQRRVFHYPGSSIGNFSRTEAARFLGQVRRNVDAEGGLLIGVDLIKSADLLVPAYDDALGVTAAFNLNVLNHVNRLIQADFNTHDWRHVALFNESKGRIEMYLETRERLLVRWSGGERMFEKGERIHTENSHKYLPESFDQLLLEAGFACDRFWTDDQGWFGVFYARPV
jgi:dimethylhistidine N-methyltransferase